MAKRNFDEINTNAAYSTIAKATRGTGKQTPANEQETLERVELMQTRGRKGVHAPRINMAFTATNHDFIKTMASVLGVTMTQFTNYVIETYRNEHGESYSKIIEMRKQASTLDEEILNIKKNIKD